MDKLEYEVQHFGFSVKQLTLERRIAIKNLLGDVLAAILKSLIKKTNISKITEEELYKQKNAVVEEIFAGFDEKLDKFQELDKKNFSIPENVLLCQDFEHSRGYTEADENRLDTDLESLKQVFFENAIMISALEMENNKYAQIENIVEKELKVHDKIQETFEANNIQETKSMIEAILDAITKTNLNL